MVLTEEEFQSAEIVAKKDNRVNKYWSGRQRDGISLCEQACCDREIQQYLFHVHGHGHGNRRSSAYKCNNYIVHEIPFLNIKASMDHGWGRYGPTNSELEKKLLESPAMKHLITRPKPAQSAGSTTNVAQCGTYVAAERTEYCIEHEQEDNGYADLTYKDDEELLEFDNSSNRLFDDEESDAIKQRKYDRIIAVLNSYEYDSSDWEPEEEDDTN